MTDKIIYDSLEDWKGGKASGYYEPTRGEIHILRGKDQERRALAHENVHASRSNKLTFKLAELMSIKALGYILLALMVLFGLYGSITAPMSLTGLIPFFFVAALYLTFYGCLAYEEMIADYTVAKSIRNLQNGEIKLP